MHLDPARLGVFVAAAVVLLVTPGPAVLYITARSVTQGLRAGLVSVLGIETGASTHVLGAALGLSAVLASSAVAFSIVKYLGAAYLIVLGVRKLGSRPVSVPSGAREPAPVPLKTIYAQGVVVSVLNPKTALFFFAFLPQFVDPKRGHVTTQMIVLGAIFVALAAISDGAYALLAGTAGRWLWRNPRFVQGERYVSGTVYLGLGAFTALSGSGGSHATSVHAP
jgi:threonine/homoserine/homoserine lactone efflux protein